MSKSRVIYFVSSLFIALACSYLGGSLLVGNSDAYEYLTTVLTVFSGFLFAVLSILGDPSLIKNGTWKVAELNRGNLNNSMIRIGYLFCVYLMALISLAVSVLLEDNNSVASNSQLWMGRITVFLSSLALILTAPLPLTISRIQMWRYDNEIERRRAERKSSEP